MGFGNIIIGITWLKLINLKLKKSWHIVGNWDEHHWGDISPGWPSEQRENRWKIHLSWKYKQFMNSEFSNYVSISQNAIVLVNQHNIILVLEENTEYRERKTGWVWQGSSTINRTMVIFGLYGLPIGDQDCEACLFLSEERLKQEFGGSLPLWSGPTYKS